MKMIMKMHRAEAEADSPFEARPEASCRECGETLPPTFFKLSTSGRPKCHSCQSEYDRQRFVAQEPRLPPAEKACVQCGLTMPASKFWHNRGHPTGLSSLCRSCTYAAKRRSGEITAAVPVPEAALPPAKTCYKCGEVRLRAAFGIDPTNRDGLGSLCKACDRAYAAQRRAAAAQAAAPATARQVSGRLPACMQARACLHACSLVPPSSGSAAGRDALHQAGDLSTSRPLSRTTPRCTCWAAQLSRGCVCLRRTDSQV